MAKGYWVVTYHAIENRHLVGYEGRPGHESSAETIDHARLEAPKHRS